MANLEKIVYCASEEAYEGIATKNENTLYLTPESGGSGGSMIYPYEGSIEKDPMNIYNVNSSLVNANAKAGDYLLASNGLFTITSVSQMEDYTSYSVDLCFSFSASGKMSVIVKEWTITNIDMNDCYATVIPYKLDATVKVYGWSFDGIQFCSSVTLKMGDDWATNQDTGDKFKLSSFYGNSEVAILQGLHYDSTATPPMYVLVVIE